MCLCTVCWCLIYCSHLPFGFSVLSKGNESPNIKFRGAAALKADTAGCQELFKLALLLTWRHRNKQFNHSSQNMSWHVVTFHWDGVTSFCCGEPLEVEHQSCELAVERAEARLHTCFSFQTQFWVLHQLNASVPGEVLQIFGSISATETFF